MLYFINLVLNYLDLLPRNCQFGSYWWRWRWNIWQKIMSKFYIKTAIQVGLCPLCKTFPCSGQPCWNSPPTCSKDKNKDNSSINSQNSSNKVAFMTQPNCVYQEDSGPRIIPCYCLQLFYGKSNFMFAHYAFFFILAAQCSYSSCGCWSI